MKDAKQFFIISLIIHLLIFILMAYIILPPVKKPLDFLDSLSVEFVKLRPVVREQKPPEDSSTQEKKAETPAPVVPVLPKPTGFSISVNEQISASARTASTERMSQSLDIPERENAMADQPLVLETVTSIPDNTDDSIVPGLQQSAESIAGERVGKRRGFRPQPSKGDSGVKGQGTRFIIPFVSSSIQRTTNQSKFSNILPSLAKGLIERSEREKMDIVFIIDTTGSMRDNVRGVRDYIHHFLKPIDKAGYDAALGLVEFSDLDVNEARVVGLTRKEDKFRKWLDKAVFFGGRDLPESGYEAILDALEKIDFRKGSQRFFIFISDAPQHDLDYDGKSRYSLDRIINILNEEGVQMDVVGADFLPVKQLARGTGGQWRHIPGGRPASDIPYPESHMIHSEIDESLPPIEMEDRVTIKLDDPAPEWVDISYKMLDPLGFKCLGTLTYRRKPGKSDSELEFYAGLDLRKFKDQPGIYTLIYRVRDSRGNQDILRRKLILREANEQETS